MAPPDIGSASPPPPMAGNTSFASSSGRYRAHPLAHILTDTTNRYPCFGDSAQNCCLGLELHLGSCQAHSLSLARPVPAPSSHCPLTHPNRELGLPAGAAPQPVSTGTSAAVAALAPAWCSASGHPSHAAELHLAVGACTTDQRQQEVCGAVRLYNITIYSGTKFSCMNFIKPL